MTEEKEEELNECCECGREATEDEGIFLGGQFYCDNCTRNCEWCEETVPSSELTYVRGDMICEACCENETFYCEECQERYHNDDYGGDDLCQSCFDSSENLEEPDTDIPFQELDNGKRLMNKCERFVGVEIEAEDGSRKDLLSYFKDNNIQRNWNMTYDGSLSGTGIEMVSQKMKGDIAFEEIRTICKALNFADYMVSNRCGLHVHFDFSKQNEKEIKKIALAYALYDNFFFRMLPESRQRNHYCERMFFQYDKIFLELNEKLDERLYNTRDTNALQSYKQNKYNDMRYGSLNLHSYYLRGSLEVRTHSGTINPEKIINWIRINNNFFDWALTKDLKYFINHTASLKQWRKILKDKDLISYYKDRVTEFSVQSRKEFVQDNKIRMKKVYSRQLSDVSMQNIMCNFWTINVQKKRTGRIEDY